MKENYMNAAAIHLIDHKGYMPFRNENGEVSYNSSMQILHSSSFGSFLLVELIDGDLLSVEQIQARLDMNRDILINMKNASAYYFYEIWVFNEAPDSDKLQAITAGQHAGIANKQYLSCLTVNLFQKEVKKHFTLPKGTVGIEKMLNEILKSDLKADREPIDINQLVERKADEYTIKFTSQVPLITYGLIAVNVIVWVLMNLYATLKGVDASALFVTFGAKENLKIMSGEYWRFVTPIFLHANLVHLAINCYSLHELGKITERMYGHAKFAVVYMIAGIIGNIASFMFSPNNGVGASGSIFGLLGALLYFGAVNPVLFKRYFGSGILITIVINVSYGFSHSGIDNFAHLGGLLGGFLASGVVKLDHEIPRKYLKRTLFIVVMVVLTAAGLLYGFSNTQNALLNKVEQLYQLNDAGQWAEAEALGEEILSKNPRDEGTRIHVLWALIISEAIQGKYDQAVAHGTDIKALNPNFSEAVDNLLNSLPK